LVPQNPTEMLKKDRRGKCGEHKRNFAQGTDFGSWPHLPKGQKIPVAEKGHRSEQTGILSAGMKRGVQTQPWGGGKKGH